MAWSDDALVEMHRSGDAEAFNELVRRHRDAVYRTCLLILGERAEAEDVVQSAFLRAHRALPRYRPEGNFVGWLQRITRNLCLNHLAARKRAPGPLEDLPLPDVRPGPQDITQSAQLGERIRWALSQLEEEFRSAIILREVEGYDYKQIAEITGVTVGTVSSRIARARAKLRSLLGEFV